MAIERTLVLIKPPCSNMTEVVIMIFMTYINSGLKMVRVRDVVLNKLLFEEIYGEHRGKRFFRAMEAAYLGHDFVALCFEGEDAVNRVRALNGATDPLKAAEGTLRRRFGNQVPRTDGNTTPDNAVHGSDSPESAVRELKLFFPEL